MVSVLGKNGKTIWMRANGLDNPPLIPFYDRKSISMERTFERDTIDVSMLRTVILLWLKVCLTDLGLVIE